MRYGNKRGEVKSRKFTGMYYLVRVTVWAEKALFKEERERGTYPFILYASPVTIKR